MIDLSIKDMFFDRPAVLKAAGRARIKSLSKAGAFIRTRSKTSIRKRKGSSPPGTPPHSHTGLLRKHIYFGYDRLSESVVVGPAKIKKGQAPRALELGQRSEVTSYRKGRKIQRTVGIRKRPYMLPALQKEKANFPELWLNSIGPR